MKKSIIIFVILAFPLILKGQIPLEQWEKFSKVTDDPKTSQLSITDKNTKNVCTIILRKIITGNSCRFHIMTELTGKTEIAPNKVLNAVFANGTESKIIYANPCKGADLICNDEFTLNYIEAHKFTNFVLEAIKKDLSNEVAFIYAIKKMGWM